VNVYDYWVYHGMAARIWWGRVASFDSAVRFYFFLEADPAFERWVVRVGCLHRAGIVQVIHDLAEVVVGPVGLIRAPEA
jgi:hypothetical protein